MNRENLDRSKDFKKSNNSPRDNFAGYEYFNQQRPLQKRGTYIKSSKRMKSNSPLSSRGRLDLFEHNGDGDELSRNNNNFIQAIRESLEVDCFKENFELNKIRVGPLSKKQPIVELGPDCEINYNLKRFLQSQKEEVVQYNLQENFSNQPPDCPGDLKGYFERNSLYRLRKEPRTCIKALLPNEPHIKLTVLRTNLDTNPTMEYYITPRGMLSSNRNTDHSDIIIGRQQATPEGIIPNDICLFYTDRATSRVHCKLVTKFGKARYTLSRLISEGFKVPREIPENFMMFLMSSHKRAGAKSPASKLYKGLYRYIFSFIKEPRKFWVSDLGSVFGTYLKLKSISTYRLEKGQTYLVGLDTFFNILDVNKGRKSYKITAQEGSNQETSNVKTKTAVNDDFMKFLLQEKLYNKCEIHGLSEEEDASLAVMVATHKATLYEDDSIFNETANNESTFERPYFKLEIQNCRGIHTSPNHLFVATSKNEFVLGRMQGCDINLNLNTISRKQCRFIYSGDSWYITDGAGGKDSANGTWISLTDYRVKRERTESEPKAIEHGAEIKISDTILKFEVFNND